MPKRGLTGALDRLQTQAQVVLGENLTSLVLFGEAVSGEAVSGEAVSGGAVSGEAVSLDRPAEVMFVLETINLVTLNQVRRVVMEARREIELLPLILTPGDLERSTDVFPVKFQTMKWRHIRLCGDDLLSDLEIDREHLRLRTEQEIKNLLFRLRRFYIERSHRGELLESTLARGVHALLRNLAVFIYLQTGEVLSDDAAVVGAAEDLGIPPEPLEGSLHLGSKKAPEDLPTLYGTFMTAVERAADLVDRHQEETA